MQEKVAVGLDLAARELMIIPLRVERCAKGTRDKEGNGNVIHKSEQQAEGNIHDVERWSMVELQGEVVSSDPLSGQALGSMAFENVSVNRCLDHILVAFGCFSNVFGPRTDRYTAADIQDQIQILLAFPS